MKRIDFQPWDLILPYVYNKIICTLAALLQEILQKMTKLEEKMCEMHAAKRKKVLSVPSREVRVSDDFLVSCTT